MKHLSYCVSYYFLIFFIYFAKFALGFGSTWELYQMFSSKHGNNSSYQKHYPSTGSKIPLIFTFKQGNAIKNITTGKGRVLFVANKREEIPRFTSDDGASMLQSDIAEETKTALKIGDKNESFSFVSAILDFVLQVISVDDAIAYLAWLRSALISYYGTNYPLLGTTATKSAQISTGRDGWGGIAFPSLEGALLSLAFLTFAVFLIDLIQNLLANLRVPTTTSSPDTGGTGGMIEIPVRGRQARESSWMSVLTNSVLSALDGIQ